MNRFFEAWRRFGDRVTRILVAAFAGVCIVAGLEAPGYGAPLWIAGTFVVFGVGLFIYNLVARPKPPRS